MSVEITIRRTATSEPSIVSAVSAIFSIVWFFI